MSEPDLTPTHFVRYDEAGAITQWGSMAAHDIALLQEQGERIAVGKGDDGSYLCLRRMRPRLKTDNPTRLEGLSLVNVPAGSIVKIEDVGPRVPERSQHEASGRVDLEFDYPGTYRVTVVSVKHLTVVFEVTA